MNPCTKESVAREFADQLQLATTRPTTRPHRSEFRLEGMAMSRAMSIRKQAVIAASAYNRRNRDQAEELEALTDELASMIAALLVDASHAQLAADQAAAELVVRDPQPVGPSPAA
jgi:hypothetical protein